jgi:hypothetical protein
MRSFSLNKIARAIFASTYVVICLIPSVNAQDNNVFEWQPKQTYILESLEIAYRKCWSNPLPDADYKKLKPIFSRSLAAHQTKLTATSARNKFNRYGQKYCSWTSRKYQKLAKQTN